MLEEAANEFEGSERNGVASARSKDDGVVVEGDEAGVADGDPMGVAAEVPVNLLRSPEGPLGVHDPALLVQPCAAPTARTVVEIFAENAPGTLAIAMTDTKTTVPAPAACRRWGMQG